MRKINIANSIFNGFNNLNGIMLCGYEWGFSKEDEKKLSDLKINEFVINESAITTFSNKVPKYGNRALKWNYDNKIKTWFSLWGHPLSLDISDPFSKTILQTNWCSSCNNKIQNIKEKCLLPESIDNFIYHISLFKPSIIIFFGSELKNLIKKDPVFYRFTSIVGDKIKPSKRLKKDFNGRKFFVSFDYFKECTVICFPHPSSSRGLSNNYIQLFEPEMNEILSEYKKNKKIYL